MEENTFSNLDKIETSLKIKSKNNVRSNSKNKLHNFMNNLASFSKQFSSTSPTSPQRASISTVLDTSNREQSLWHGELSSPSANKYLSKSAINLSEPKKYWIDFENEPIVKDVNYYSKLSQKMKEKKLEKHKIKRKNPLDVSMKQNQISRKGLLSSSIVSEQSYTSTQSSRSSSVQSYGIKNNHSSKERKNVNQSYELDASSKLISKEKWQMNDGKFLEGIQLLSARSSTDSFLNHSNVLLAKAYQRISDRGILFEQAYSHFMKKEFEEAYQKFLLFLQHNENHVYAIFYCGLIAMNTENYASALAFLKKSLKLGHSISAYYLGLLYYEGLGIPQNDEIALAYFEYSGKKEHALSMYYAAKIQLRISKNDSDFCVAKAWLDKSVQHGILNSIEQKEITAFYQMMEGMRALQLIRHSMESSATASKAFDLDQNKSIHLAQNHQSHSITQKNIQKEIQVSSSLPMNSCNSNNDDQASIIDNKKSSLAIKDIIIKRYTFPDHVSENIS